jgi:hypothetical protein
MEKNVNTFTFLPVSRKYGKAHVLPLMQLMVVKPSVGYFKIRYSDCLKFCGISYFIISLTVFAECCPIV